MSERNLALSIALVLIASLFWASAHGQGNKQLIMNSEVKCDLQGSVLFSSSGDLLVEVVDLAECINEEVVALPEAPQVDRTVLQAVAPGEVRINWSSSAGASECKASSSPTVSGWSGSIGTGQNQQTLLSGLSAGSYDFTLSCSNAAGESTPSTVSVNIASFQQCAGRQPPSGWVRLGEAGTNNCYYDRGWKGKDCTRWDGGISDVPFYEEKGLAHRLAFAGRPNAKQFLAIELDTTGMSPQESGRLQNSSSDPFALSPTAIVTISSCPGDFHKSAVMSDTGCYGTVGAFSAPYRWGGSGTSEGCQLDSNATYYLNIIPTTSPDGTAPDNLETHPNCEGGPCGRVMTWN